MNVWKESKDIIINNFTNLNNGFIYEFNNSIPNEMQKVLHNFMNWVQQNYNITTPLYVEFINADHLIYKDNQRVGYIFDWYDYDKYPNIYETDKIPLIKLQVKEGKWSKSSIIESFIEALTLYFYYIMNEITDELEIDYSVVDYILNEYKRINPYL